MKLLALTLFLLITVSVFSQEANFPELDGEYKVGTSIFFLTDSSRLEVLSPEPDDLRRYMVRVWYPANVTSQAELRYLEGYNIDTLRKKWSAFGLPKTLFDFAAKINTNSFINAPVLRKRTKYPVLIFSHGYGVAVPEMYTIMMEHLASNGYIVFGITHPYESLQIIYPEGNSVFVEDRSQRFFDEAGPIWLELDSSKDQKQNYTLTEQILNNSLTAAESLDFWVKDAQHLIDKLSRIETEEKHYFLKDKLDLNNIGAFGHSFGGAMAGQLCFVDKRVKAGINLDGFQYGSLLGKKLDFPFVMVNSDGSDMYNRPMFIASTSAIYYITIAGTKHFIFSDMPAYPPIFDKVAFLGSIDNERFISLQNDLIESFFNRYLKKERNDFPAYIKEEYPELKIEIIK